jgi:hypothetical protein
MRVAAHGWLSPAVQTSPARDGTSRYIRAVYFKSALIESCAYVDNIMVAYHTVYRYAECARFLYCNICERYIASLYRAYQPRQYRARRLRLCYSCGDGFPVQEL